MRRVLAALVLGAALTSCGHATVSGQARTVTSADEKAALCQAAFAVIAAPDTYTSAQIDQAFLDVHRNCY